MNLYRIFLLILFACGVTISYAQTTNWQIVSDSANINLGGPYISWTFDKDKKLPYSDNIEMAGRKVVGIIDYTVDTAGYVAVNRKIIYPQLHPLPKDTDPWWQKYRAYLTEEYDDSYLPKLYVSDKQLTLPPVEKIEINGILKIVHQEHASGLKIVRSFLPSMTERLFKEHWVIKNKSDEIINIDVHQKQEFNSTKGTEGLFLTLMTGSSDEEINLHPNQEHVYELNWAAMLDNEFPPEANVVKERIGYLNTINSSLILETPVESLNTLFKFSKIRAAESIYDSKLGPIHSPGGGRYYVGIWANDQAEYVSPFFSYLGYDLGHESAMNCYRAFATKMNQQYDMLPYAFEVEEYEPPSKLDRGDAAMIAYGAAQYVLATGDKVKAQELWPLIEWCLEYCRRKLNNKGVVQSQSDEMEGRIETGDANLSTSSLYYGALRHAEDLSVVVGKKKLSKVYSRQADELAKAIENYFGSTVEGLQTYKYYDAHKKLRHWICMPLVVGINKRKEQTIEALFDRLWTENGVYVEKNDDPDVTNIFWDRGTLYALRGAMVAGERKQSVDRLIEYSEKRLLGDRVPYVVEAYPEGAMAHLSAESGLYCRVFIEGMFGIYPTGLNSFNLTPKLPDGWDKMALRNIKAFGGDFDVEIKKVDSQIEVKVRDNQKGKVISDSRMANGDTIQIKL